MKTFVSITKESLFSLLVLLMALVESVTKLPTSHRHSYMICLRLRGGAETVNHNDLWESDSYEPEHRFLHPDQLMLDTSFDDRMNLSDFDREVMNRTRTWMRELVMREKEDKDDGSRRPYFDISDVEIDSEEYKFYDNESNPNRFKNGCAPRVPAKCSCAPHISTR